MTTTVRELADLVRGQVRGDAGLTVTAARPLGEAGAGHVTFLESEKNAAHLRGCRATAVVVPAALALPEGTDGVAYIQVADPLGAFVAIVRHLHGHAEPAPHGIDPLASVHPTARVGADASVFPFAVIGALAVRRGEADALICGVEGRYAKHLRDVRQIIGLREGVTDFSALSLLISQRGATFFGGVGGM